MIGRLLRRFWAWLRGLFGRRAPAAPPRVPSLSAPEEPGWLGDWPVSATWAAPHDVKPHKAAK